MFLHKKNYYLYVENTRILDLSLIKKKNKFNIIYRNLDKSENLQEIINYRMKCKQKFIRFYVYNNIELANKCCADGIYISSYNKKIYYNKRFELIGSAHNFKEINTKIKQGCKKIIISRLFKTDYENKKSYLGVVKFNFKSYCWRFKAIPLGGIRFSNLNKLKNVNCDSLAILSEVKKKAGDISPAFLNIL